MGSKSRSNHSLTGSMTQDKYDRMFRKKTRIKKQANTKKLNKQRKRGS